MKPNVRRTHPRIFRQGLNQARSCVDHKGRLIGTTVDPLPDKTPDALREAGWVFLGANFDPTIGPFACGLPRTAGAIQPDGTLSHLYNVGPRGAGAYLQVVRIGYVCSRGQVPKCFCFEGLAEYYKKIGWVETDRAPWNPEFAPEGWNPELQGYPDVVWMNYPKVTREVMISTAYREGVRLYMNQK